MRILVIHPGALGDIILSLPAVRVLREIFPEAEVTFAGNTDFASVAVREYSERLAAFSSLPLHLLYQPETLCEDDARIWKSYDRIVCWTGYGSAEFRRNFTGIHPNVLVAPWRPVPDERRHVSLIFVESLYPWIPVQDAVVPASISVSDEMRLLAEQWLDERGWSRSDLMVALHPGAGGVEKRWHWQRFQALAAVLLKNRSLKIVIIEGPAEPMCGLQVAEGLDPLRVRIAKAVPLGLTAALLASCRLFVGNDSGIAHLSAGLGISSVILFGPTEPAHWSPLGQSVLALRGDGGDLDELSLDEVLDGIASLRATIR